MYRNFNSSHRKKAVAENFLSLSVLQVTSFLVPLITMPYLFRVLGPSKCGLIAFASAFVQYFAAIIEYGFGLSATREIAINQNDPHKVSEIFCSVLIIKIFFFCISALFFLTLLLAVPRFRNDWVVFLITFCGLIGNVLLPVYFFQGMDKMRYYLLSSLTVLATTAAIFFFIKAEKDYLNLPLINACGAIASGVIAVAVVLFRFNVRVVFPSKGQLKRQLIEGWHVFVANLSSSVPANTRVFVVGIFASDTITGYYSAAERLITMLFAFPLSVLAQSVVSKLSALFITDELLVRKLLKKLQWFTSLMYLTIVAVFFPLAPAIMTFFCGKPFPEAVLSFRLLLIPLLLAAYNAFRLQSFFIYGKSSIFAHVCLVAGIAGTASCFILAFLFSYVGAAVSLIILVVVMIWMSVKNEALLITQSAAKA